MKLALAALLLVAPQTRELRHELSVELRDGERTCTIHADNALLHELMGDLAREAELELQGLDASTSRTLVSVDLRDRPLRQAVRFIAGSVGLAAEVRGGVLLLRPSFDDSADANALYEASIAVSAATLRDFSDHELAPQALRDQAIIEERRGNDAAARARYDELVGRYADSPLANDALFAAGNLLMREEAWQDAADRFSELLRSEREHGLEIPARLELAWCVVRIGQHERALYMIDAIDALDSAASRHEELRRKQVRARALAGVGQGEKALALLDEIDTRLAGPADRRESLELRALACAAAGQHGNAARAWLAFSQLCEGPRREAALLAAATAALETHDEVGALFAAEIARKDGVLLDGVVREARAALGLDSSAAPAESKALERAERLCDGGSFAESLKLLRGIAAQLGTLEEAARARFARCHARALSHEVGVDAALAHLREHTDSISSPELRRELYLLAGELLEGAGRIDEAIEAYRGRI
ncbi:MAG: hypothetical protein FJ298_10560 [Planctomycetes bacterium]|nr:hypothetical protein [Planctomycetota bacterium]